jgi:hypothetical protein
MITFSFIGLIFLPKVLAGTKVIKTFPGNEGEKPAKVDFYGVKVVLEKFLSLLV